MCRFVDRMDKSLSPVFYSNSWKESDNHHLPCFVQCNLSVTALVNFSPWVTLYDRVISQDPIHD